MIKYLKILMVLFIGFVSGNALASETKQNDEPLNVREFILDHVADAYEWHITTVNHKHISVPLPVILYSTNSGWHVFLSSVFHHEPIHNGFYIATEGDNKGKIVEKNTQGAEKKPLDI